MSALQPRHWQLLAALADGSPQHVFALSKALGVKPQQINGLWQQMPPHIRGLLRQHDGQWRLVRPLAVFDEARVQQIATAHGFQTALLNELGLNISATLNQDKSITLTIAGTAGAGVEGFVGVSTSNTNKNK